MAENGRHIKFVARHFGTGPRPESIDQLMILAENVCPKKVLSRSPSPQVP